uniref:Uncharacterized protein n=1 Tax=Odontella aurita TaxID=265563 RepID=A0A7S4JPW4_9STRA
MSESNSHQAASRMNAPPRIMGCLKVESCSPGQVALPLRIWTSSARCFFMWKAQCFLHGYFAFCHKESPCFDEGNDTYLTPPLGSFVGCLFNFSHLGRCIYTYWTGMFFVFVPY